MAKPHPCGNRIDLEWANPDPVQFRVRVVRREGTHPVSPEDGVIVAESNGLTSAVDKNLKGETVYYYTLFPYKVNPLEYQIDIHNRTSAMATARYNMTGQMCDLLPAIYHRYDTVLPVPASIPAGMPEEDKQKGQLRRFLDLPGYHLDQLYSFARAMLDLYNCDKVDGLLLPLLAQWIGWKTDYNLEIETQRNEIRNAPALFKTVGIIPTVEATVKRISGWESKTKEFVHNVFLSNRPERLNIWARQRNSAGEWSEPTEPLSLDFAYEGRPAAARDGNGALWLFYHTFRNGRWNIWYKILFDVGLEFKDDLISSIISTGLQQAFNSRGFLISQNATIEEKDNVWLIIDSDNREIYTIKEESGNLKVCRGSQPFTDYTKIDKYPTIANQRGTLWVFWSTYDETEQKWRISYRTQNGGAWSAMNTNEPFADATNERKTPWAVVDNTNGLWLFWLERVGSRWQLKYNRHDGTTWGAVKIFPLDDGVDPRVESDLFVLFHPSNEIWVFWARKESTAESGHTRWSLVYRTKGNTTPDETGWSTIESLSDVPPIYHDREPAALVNANGNIEIFWSPNRDGSWSIWSNTLDITTHTWGTAERVTTNPYSHRDPLPVSLDNGMLLIYRSNESLSYTSTVYRATKTVDFRYAGCTTVDTRNAAKIALREKFEDFQTYTYDAGKNGVRTNEDWYARDTIGIYLTPDTMDAEKIALGISRIAQVLGEFMPVTDRAVFLTRSDIHTEYVYTYALPLAADSYFISESLSPIRTP